MSIQFFEDSSSTSGELEFANDYLKKFPKDNGKAFPVKEIILARSGKGYLASTDSFLCWLWKREKTTALLLEALQAYVDQRYGYTIVAVLDKGDKNGFKLGVDSELPCMWYGSAKKYSVEVDIPTLETQGGNPFLIQPVPSIPTTDVVASNSKVKGK